MRDRQPSDPGMVILLREMHRSIEEIKKRKPELSEELQEVEERMKRISEKRRVAR